ncbi:hypothetical protein P4S63_15085 [Pseudoalteromonas sp. B193]
MKPLYFAAAASNRVFNSALAESTKPELLTPELLVDLPNTFNSPASSDMDKEGNVYITSPNFHNDALIKIGEMQTPTALV